LQAFSLWTDAAHSKTAHPSSYEEEKKESFDDD